MKISNPPSHLAYAKNSDGYWVKIGSAWQGVDKNGKAYISITVDCLPLKFDGKITLHLAERDPSP